MRWLALLAASATVTLHLGRTVVLPHAKPGDRISCVGLHSHVSARLGARRASVEHDYLQLAIRPLFQGGYAASCWYTRSPRASPPLGFEPQAAAFATSTHGWELGVQGCWRCFAVRRTTNGGRTWEMLPPPGHIAVADVRFADDANGFLFGPGLYVTHSGGRSWSRVDLPAIHQLEIGAGYAFALTVGNPPGAQVADVWRSRVGTDSWRIVGQFAAPFGARIAVVGRDVALLREGDTGPGGEGYVSPSGIWASRSSGDRWGRHATPCRATDAGAAAIALDVGSPDRWLVDCYNNLQSMQGQHTRHHLYEATHFGRGWRRLADPSTQGWPDLLVATGSGTIELATQSGAGDQLHISHDGGRTFRVALRGGGVDTLWPDLGILDQRTGFVVRPGEYGEDVLVTDDGARHWHAIDVG